MSPTEDAQNSEMAYRLLEFSIVIVANDHNPSIINPDFLMINEIVDKEWRRIGDAISTPAFSKVAYDNNLSITVDPNRLNIVDGSGDLNIPNSPALKVARKYVEVLPHIRYSAVGINFRVFYEIEDPDQAIKSQYLKPGIWLESSDDLHGIGFKFAHPMENGKKLITVESAVVNTMDPSDGSVTQKTGIMVFGNYHRDCKEYPAARQLDSCFGLLPNDWSDFNSILAKLGGNHV
ncbi:MAG: hypothetical protein D6694_04880 [Gammaproteobacteria bacterium]|nr:MAG: hypothetical protein D6694_04880 [Gammaproteobacteria bacterium]